MSELRIMRIKSFLIHFLFLSAIIFIVGLPFYTQRSHTPAGTTYPWIHKMHEDYYGYLSYIRQGRAGASAHIDQYVTEETIPTRVHIYYLLLGHVGKLTGLSDISLYHIGWVVPLAFFYVIISRLVSLLSPARYIPLTLFLILFAGPFPNMPFSFFGTSFSMGQQWWSQMDPYSRLSYKPHHFAGIACMIAAFYFLHLFQKEKKALWGWAAGLTNAIGIFVFAVPGLLFLMAVGLSAGVWEITQLYDKGNKKEREERQTFIRRHAGFGLLAVPSFLSLLLVYTSIQSSNVNLLSWESAQFNHDLNSYGRVFLTFLLQYGVLPLLWIPGLWRVWKKRTYEHILVASMTLLPFLLYVLATKNIIPIPSIRMVYGAPYVFGGLLAVWGIWELEKMIRPRWGKILFITSLVLIVIFNALGSLWSYWWPEVAKNEIFHNIYIPARYISAMRYLQDIGETGDNVMSTFYTGMMIPAYTDKKVYIGHEAKNDFPVRWWHADEFMNGRLDVTLAKKLLKNHRIVYVLWDTGVLPPQYESFLKEVYEVEDVKIYRVRL